MRVIHGSAAAERPHVVPSASHRWRSVDDLKLPLRISCYSAGHSSNNFQSGWWRGFRRFGSTRRHERASRRLQRRRSKDADEPVTMATETTIRPADPIQLTRAPTKQRLAERRLAGPHPARNRRPERGTTGRGWSSPAAPSLKEQHDSSHRLGHQQVATNRAAPAALIGADTPSVEGRRHHESDSSR